MPIYNQRWLREHQAVPTPLGWKRHNTTEMLKMQKGLEHLMPEQPIFKSSKFKITNRIVVINPETNTGTFTYTYTIDESDYEPILIEPSNSGNKNIDYTVDRASKTITCTINNLTVDGDSTQLYLYVEGQRSSNVYETIYFSIDYPNPTFNRVYVGSTSRTFYINNSASYVGNGYFGYRVFDTILPYEKEDVEVVIEYTGSATITSKVSVYSSIGNLIDIYSRDLMEGEEFYVYLKVKGVTSEKIKFVTKNLITNTEFKPFEELTEFEQLEFFNKEYAGSI